MPTHEYDEGPSEEVRRLRDAAWNIHAASGDYEHAAAVLDGAIRQTLAIESDDYHELMAGHHFVLGRVKLAEHLAGDGAYPRPRQALASFERASGQFAAARRVRGDSRPSQVELHMTPHKLTAEELAYEVRHPVREIGRLLYMSARSESPAFFAPETVNRKLDVVGLGKEKAKRIAYSGLTAVAIGLNRMGRPAAARSIARWYVLPGKKSAHRMSDTSIT